MPYKSKTTQLKQKSKPTDNDYGYRIISMRETLVLFHVAAKGWIGKRNKCNTKSKQKSKNKI